MAQYDAEVAAAKEALKEFGQELTFTRDIASSFDEVTGEETAGDPVTITGFGALFDYQASEIDDKTILRGDSVLYFEPGVGAPEIDDTVPANGKTWRVMNVETLSPSGQDILYTLQLRA